MVVAEAVPQAIMAVAVVEVAQVAILLQVVTEEVQTTLAERLLVVVVEVVVEVFLIHSTGKAAQGVVAAELEYLEPAPMVQDQ
jgi:hypothetical protein